MVWWKKSNYKKAEERNWYHDDDANNNQGYQGWGGYYWKPKYDMSVSLETRVMQLIRSITGKNLRLAQAAGWGNDDKYFYYNPADLAEATDDEVLGRILQQLGKEMYVDKERVKVKNEGEPDYRHLLDSLEANRADKQLAMRYAGTTYYAGELWAVRKFKDNPLLRYQKVMSVAEFIGNHGWKNRKGAADFKDFSPEDQASITKQYKDYQDKLKQEQNDSWEFCFNIHAYQNGEVGFDFTKDKIAGDFEKALPFIAQYLNAPSFTEALAVYPDIKKYYPIPPKQQQQQMDREMGATQGLSQEQLRAMGERMAAAEAQKGGNGREVDGAGVKGLARGKKGSLDHEDYNVKRELAVYTQAKTMLAPIIGVLHALISSILKDNAIKRYARPFKRGKIDAKRMYKYMATDNLRIFKKPRVISKKDYTMAILLDQSGSMAYGLSENAFYGALVLAEVFEQLGLPYEVLGFRDEVFAYKKFNKGLERAVIPSIREIGGGTDDLNAIKVLRNHLRQFDPSHHYRKGVFVITDGEGADPIATKELITEIEKLDHTTIFGLGIGGVDESALKQTYNHYLRVGNIKDLPTTLVELMKTQFRRG